MLFHDVDPDNLPPFPISDWDRAIMKLYPLRFQIKSVKLLDTAVEFCRQNFPEGSFTWKGPVFFFKNPEDAALFVLRWS
jgi:hypothetical protein